MKTRSEISVKVLQASVFFILLLLLREMESIFFLVDITD